MRQRITTSRQQQLAKEAFRAAVEMLLTEHGAQRNESWQATYDWTLETQAGPLRLSIDQDQDSPGAIMGRFDDPRAAVKLVDCNPYSGKWNHHYFGWKVREAFEDFRDHLAQVLQKGSESCPNKS